MYVAGWFMKFENQPVIFSSVLAREGPHDVVATLNPQR